MHRPSPRAVRRVVAALAVLAAVTATPLSAFAHAELTTSDPKADATLPVSPAAITLDFSDDLRSNSHFEVLDDAGATVLAGEPDPDVKDRMAVAVVTPLAPGLYVVKWTTVATDKDVARGEFAFTVAEPSPSPATASPTSSTGASPSASASPSGSPASSPSASPAPSPSADGGQTGGSGGSDVVLPILVALILVGGLGLWLARRERRV